MTITMKRYLLVGLSVVVVGVAITYVMTAEAVTPKTVGTLSLMFAPVAGAEYEYVEFTYAGYGTADLTGWELRNSSGLVMDLTGVSISNGGSYRVCEAGATDSACLSLWGGNDSFTDNGDSLFVINKFGASIINVTYQDATANTLKNGSGDYITEVYEKKDKIMICHGDAGAYKAQNVSVSSLAGRYEKDNNNNHMTHEDDIIPSFMYDIGNGFGYVPGNHWPDMASVHAAGCQ